MAGEPFHDVVPHGGFVRHERTRDFMCSARASLDEVAPDRERGTSEREYRHVELASEDVDRPSDIGRVEFGFVRAKAWYVCS